MCYCVNSQKLENLPTVLQSHKCNSRTEKDSGKGRGIEGLLCKEWLKKLGLSGLGKQ